MCDLLPCFRTKLGGINLYGYAYENQLRFRDPSGLRSKPSCTAAFFHHLLDFTESDTAKEPLANKLPNSKNALTFGYLLETTSVVWN
jgi:hypothetical protein